jgi:ABC-2 type transport system ATP-binding protein
MIMNIIARDEGRIELLGRDPARDRDLLRRVGYLPEERGLYRKMKVIDAIVFFARLKGMATATAKDRGMEWLTRMSLADWSDAQVETLSKGMQQKVQFITTVMHEPDVLILDEPQSGLDPVNQEVLRDTIIGARAAGRTVLLSTHYMNEAERMCDAVCIIARGRKILDGPVREVRLEHRANDFYVEFDEPTEAVIRFFDAGRLLVSSRRDGHGWHIEPAPGVGTTELLGALNALDSPIARFEHLLPSLHDIFVRKVTGAAQPRRMPEHSHA